MVNASSASKNASVRSTSKSFTLLQELSGKIGDKVDRKDKNLALRWQSENLHIKKCF
jgi:hypothetical protein